MLPAMSSISVSNFFSFSLDLICLFIAVKALRDITTDMKSLARKYSSADDVEKEKIKDILKKKTPQKKELESLVAKLEKNAI